MMSPVPQTAYIALGSNVGDRQRNLDDALALLDRETQITVVRVATPIETDPVGCPKDSAPFLNSAAELTVDLEPLELLERLLRAEESLGRRRSVLNAPRTIDLDLLLFGSLVLYDMKLELPHPRMHERAFVLIPLAEIAPGVNHPLLGKTIRDLRDVLTRE